MKIQLFSQKTVCAGSALRELSQKELSAVAGGVSISVTVDKKQLNPG